jgi:multiple sugar transport system permease protein
VENMSISGSQHRRQLLLLLPIIVLLLATFAYPIARAFFLSFYNVSFGSAQSHFVGLDNFATMLLDPVFWHDLGNSFYWTAGNLLIQLSIPIGLALLLNRRIRGINFARAAVMLPWVAPTVTIAVCMRWMLLPRIGIISEMLNQMGFGSLHLLGGTGTAMPTLILLNSWKFLPFGTLMILASLQTIPASIYEAARVDGAGAWQRFRYITFPYITAMIWFVGFLAFSWNFNTFDLIWLTTQGGPGSATQTLPILIYRTAFKTFRLGEASAISIAIAVILVVIGALYFKSVKPKGEQDP